MECLWYGPTQDLDLGDLPERPTDAQIEEARHLVLDELLGDFPFVQEPDRAHAVSAIVLPFVREMIDGPTPLHDIEAPTPGTGKGLLAAAISTIATGRGVEAGVLATTESEVRKMITASMAAGKGVVLLDNICQGRVIGSSALSSVLTATEWTDRLLGHSRMVTSPNRALWIMTANDPRFSTELARRTIRIRIDPKVKQPWLRAEFRHPDLLAWVRENRSHLVRAILVLVRAWLAAGRPMGQVRLGSFESWSGVLGGILEVAGIPGFLRDLDQLHCASDPSVEAWRDFLTRWGDTHDSRPVSVGELNGMCDQHQLLIDVRGSGTERSRQTRLGNALQRLAGREFLERVVVPAASDTKHKGTTKYAFVPVADGPQHASGGNGDGSSTEK